MTSDGSESPAVDDPELSDARHEIIALDTDGGGVVIYDDQRHTAWISSTTAVSLTDAR